MALTAGGPRPGQGGPRPGADVALGGDACSDLAVVRAEPAVFGPVAFDPTLSRTITTLAADVDTALGALDRARAAARARVWQLAGPHAPTMAVTRRT